MKNSISMTQLAATFAGSMGVTPPRAADNPIPLVEELLHSRGLQKAEKLLIYNPDAVGMWLFQKYTDWFAPVIRHTQLGVPVQTVMPSVTPVCFGTMYTGVLPEVHGIQRYEKHQLDQESLFDVLPAAGIRTAIVAVANSSMAILFTGRNVDYYTLPYDEEVTEKACTLLQENRYDAVIVYNQEYDDVMHATGTESEQSLQAVRNHIAAFDRLCTAAESAWAGYDTMVCWATDHGIHDMDAEEIRYLNSLGAAIPEDGSIHGNHGSDRESDLNVMHFFGAWKGNRAL